MGPAGLKKKFRKGTFLQHVGGLCRVVLILCLDLTFRSQGPLTEEDWRRPWKRTDDDAEVNTEDINQTLAMREDLVQNSTEPILNVKLAFW